jgi:uncharacterized membrane protein
MGYGGFTPAGNIFSILTSIGMSVMFPPLAIAGVVIALAVTLIVWVGTVMSFYIMHDFVSKIDTTFPRSKTASSMMWIWRTRSRRLCDYAEA